MGEWDGGSKESRDWVGAGDEGEQELKGAGRGGNSGWREQGLGAVSGAMHSHQVIVWQGTTS